MRRFADDQISRHQRARGGIEVGGGVRAAGSRQERRRRISARIRHPGNKFDLRPLGARFEGRNRHPERNRHSVSHNPVSNMMLGDGVAPVVEMLRQGRQRRARHRRRGEQPFAGSFRHDEGGVTAAESPSSRRRRHRSLCGSAHGDDRRGQGVGARFDRAARSKSASGRT